MKIPSRLIMPMLIIFLANNSFADKNNDGNQDETTNADLVKSETKTSKQYDAANDTANDNLASSTKKLAISENLRLIDKALDFLEKEPSLAVLQQAALKLSDADVERSLGWMRSTNVQAILPIIKLTAQYDMERDESLDIYQDEPDRWGADTDNDLGFQITVQWNLPELIFNPDEVRVYSALANRAARRETLLTILVGYYFERQKLIVEEIINPSADLETILTVKIRIGELTAVIDALTGGALTRNLAKEIRADNSI